MTAQAANMINELDILVLSAERQIPTLKTLEDIEDMKYYYLGRRGMLSEVIRPVGMLDIEERNIVLSKADNIGDKIRSMVQEAHRLMP